MLDSHPAVAAYGELFLSSASGHPLWGRGDAPFFAASTPRSQHTSAKVLRPIRVVRYLNHLSGAAGSAEAVGFKLMYSEARKFPELLLYATLRRIRVVHLVRLNLLDVITSRAAAQARDVYHAWADGSSTRVAGGETVRAVADGAAPASAAGPRFSKVYLDPDRVLADIKRLDRQVRAARTGLRLSRTPTLEVAYERVTRDTTAAFERVLRFIGVDDADTDTLQSSMVKINPLAHSDVIANYAEIAQRLERTDFARFLR